MNATTIIIIISISTCCLPSPFVIITLLYTRSQCVYVHYTRLRLHLLWKTFFVRIVQHRQTTFGWQDYFLTCFAHSIPCEILLYEQFYREKYEHSNLTHFNWHTQFIAIFLVAFYYAKTLFKSQNSVWYCVVCFQLYVTFPFRSIWFYWYVGCGFPLS